MKPNIAQIPASLVSSGEIENPIGESALEEGLVPAESSQWGGGWGGGRAWSSGNRGWSGGNRGWSGGNRGWSNGNGGWSGGWGGNRGWSSGRGMFFLFIF